MLKKLDIEEYYQHIKRQRLRAKRKRPTLLEEKQPKTSCTTCRKMKTQREFEI